jgi:hypothetical protein
MNTADISLLRPKAWIHTSPEVLLFLTWSSARNFLGPIHGSTIDSHVDSGNYWFSTIRELDEKLGKVKDDKSGNKKIGL